MISTATQTISCTVSRVVHPREPFTDGQPRFCVLLTSAGKATGMLPFYPETGMRLKLTGERREYNGELQFKFSRALHDAPADPKALLDYVASIAKGIGPKTAERIWAEYGAEWQTRIDDMKPSVSLALHRTMDALAANKARSELTVYMISIGGSPRMADAAWAAWGENAAATIEANPYLIATLPGLGFKTVDGDIRKHFRIGDADIRRATAAIDYALRDMMESSGDSVVSRDALYSQFHELNVPRSVASIAMAKLVGSGRVVFVGMDKVTTSQVVKHEGDLYRYITDNASSQPSKLFIPYDEIRDIDVKFDDSQVIAIAAATSNVGLTVINGGAGAGKTTIIKAICQILERRGCSVDLCAFAGKAAARLREATGHRASTIHSMLAFSGEGLGFTAGNLHGRSVVVDEASMVPSSLLYEITKRDPERLILVGDQAQLQPVGIGSPFHDVIDTLPTVVHTLTTCYRNKEAVFAAASQVRNGELPDEGKSRNEEFAVMRFDTPEAVHAYIDELVKSGAIDFDHDLVLSPRNGEGEEPAAATVKSLNASIQALQNPHEEGVKFLAEDRVMCTKNFPKLDIWNGTTGWITRVDGAGKPYFLPDDADSEYDEIRLGEKEQQAAITPAWCLTVHKAQGSQYRDVYVVCLRRDAARLFDRSMLYTAITRAKRKCVLLTDDGIDRIIGAVRRRNTYLRHLFKGEL